MAEIPVVSRGMGRKPPSKIRIETELAYVDLTRGLVAILDAIDVPVVTGYRWVALVNSQTGHAYAVRFERGRCILMHRVLLDAPDESNVDHRDGDGLNNRRSNIRLATSVQNNANSVVNRRNMLGLKGASAHKLRFRANIQSEGKRISLGSYRTKEEAAAAYRGAAKALWGDYAYDPNEKTGPDTP